MKNLISAIQFLTILPFGKPGVFEPSGMIRFFPFVGILLGFLVAVLDIIAVTIWNPLTAAVLDIVLLAVVTGGLHLDGLGDTADGLYGHRSKEKTLAIMKDSRIGAMGLIAILCVMAVKWAGISSLDAHRTGFLILIPGFSRAAMLFGFKFLPYGRPNGGTGQSFFDTPLKPVDFWGLIPLTAAAIFLGQRGLLLILTFIVLLTINLSFYKKRLDCITGDMLGAMGEIMEAGLFLAVSAGGV